MFLNNSLATGAFAVHGQPIDLSKVECDTFVVGARTDHLTAWKACYATTQLLRRDRASSPCPRPATSRAWSILPGNPKMTVATAPAAEPDPEEWLTESEPDHRLVVGAVGRLGRGPLRRAPPGTHLAWAAPGTRPVRPLRDSTSSPRDPALAHGQTIRRETVR